MKHILIIGGGPAGLAAAVTAARLSPQIRVTVTERLDRVGKKLLATGNGRCNLTNLRAGPEHYASSQPEALARILQTMPSQSALDFFESLGLLCQEEEEGRVYPFCRQASMVADVLLQALGRLSVQVLCGWEIQSLERRREGFFLQSASGQTQRADGVILAAGGQAAPKLGSNGSGFSLARQLGHRCAPLYPALVPLRCLRPEIGLKGLRARAGLTLLQNGKAVGRETGEVQFTDYGLSGIPAMQLSGLLHRKKPGEDWQAGLDLLPQLSEGEVLSLLRGRQAAFPQETLETFLLGTVSKRIGFALLKSLGLQPLSRKIGSLSPNELARLAKGCKDWRFPLKDTLGWDQAQATGGGVLLEEIHPDTMASRLAPGLYLAGEVLDAVGDCGGFNLHWAWCTGLRAGQSAGEALL